MINGVIYARYSCEKQTENSILGQVRECSSFAEKNDIYITKVYKDEAISGRTANKRPAFMQMIKDGYAHLFDVVIVWKGDRFSRSRADAARYKGELKKLGIRVLSATEANVTGPEAILMDGINEAFAEYFSVELAAKVERGMTQNVIEGKFNGGRMPIGYKKDENGKIVIDENKAFIVRELFDSYVIGGQTVMDICNFFKMKGYLDNNGKYIPHGTLQNMLNNPRYYGYYEFKGTVNMNVFPPIISEETFKKAKERLTINHKARGKFHAKEPFYFRHLMRCKYCNAEMHCEAGTSGTGNKYYYYRCSRAHEMKHPSVRYNKEEIEEIIFREIFNFFQDKDFGDMLINDIIKSYKSLSTDTELKKKALADTIKKLDNLVIVVEKAGNVEPFLKRIEELNEIKEKQELEVKKCEPIDLEKAKEDIREYFFFIKQYDTWNEETKKAFVEIFIDSVYVTEETIDIVFKFKNDIGLCVHHLEVIVQSGKHMAHQAKSRTMPFYCDGKLLGITFDLKPFIEARKARLNNKENHKTSGSFLNSGVANKTISDYNMVVFGTDMTFEEKIKELLKMNRGYVTRKDIDKYQIPSMYLLRYSKKHNLKQIVRGFYAEENWIVDPYVVFQYTYPRYIFSFNSAIYLHELGDIMPSYLEVTGPRNYRPMSKNRDDVIAHTDTVNETYNLGIISITTSLGNVIKVYDKEKTICDLIKFKDKIEFEVYAKALNIYAKSKDKNINKLMEYAYIMNVKDKVRNEMGVILNGN